MPDSLQYSLLEAQDKVVYQEARSEKILILWELAVEISIHLAILWVSTVKLGDTERFDKEQIGVKEPFPVNKRQLPS